MIAWSKVGVGQLLKMAVAALVMVGGSYLTAFAAPEAKQADAKSVKPAPGAASVAATAPPSARVDGHGGGPAFAAYGPMARMAADASISAVSTFIRFAMKFPMPAADRPRGAAVKLAAPSTTSDFLALARTDSLALLKLAKAKHDENVRDYTVTLVRQERDNKGRLGAAETMSCKFRKAPFNVYLQWLQGAGRVDKALYAPSLVGPDILVHPTGLVGLFFPVINVELNGKHAAAAQKIRYFGFQTILGKLVERGIDAEKRNELTTVFLGESTVGDRPTIGIEWRLPHTGNYQYGRIVVHLCRQTLLPLAVSLWDFQGQLQASYEYKDLRLNVGLTENDFSRKTCGLEG